MILKDIETKLKEIDPNVFYGAASDKMKETRWDYIVFNRSVLRVNQNKTGFTTVYSVHIIREDFIPEGLDETVINKVLEISGMRLASNEFSYDYVVKPNTDMVVEMLTIDFVKPKKA